MQLKLDLAARNGSRIPIAITAEATATISDVAAAIRAGETQVPAPADPILTLQTLADNGARIAVLPPRSLLTETTLRSGQRVQVVEWLDSRQVPEDAAPARLRVLAGPQAGDSFPLHAGPNFLGRGSDCDVVLHDQLISRWHARVTVAERIEISDLNSANGIVIGDEQVGHAVLGPKDRAVLGDSVVAVEWNPALVLPAAQGSTEFNRSPLVRRTYEGRQFDAPRTPERPKPSKFPLIAMAAPLVMGVIMYAISHNLLSIVFVALSPLIALGTYIDRKWTDGKSVKAERQRYADDLEQLTKDIDDGLAEEREARRAEVLTLDNVVRAGFELTQDLWHRRPEDEAFLTLNLGYGRSASRHSMKLPERGDADAETWNQLLQARDRSAFVDEVPIMANLRRCGNLGVAGPLAWQGPIARNLVAQLTCLHSPAELVMAAIASVESAPRWDWLMWLPHVGSPYSPISGPHLASATGAVSALVSGLEELMAARREKGTREMHVPAIVLLVEDDAPVERGRLVALAEDGPEVGIHLLWLADVHEKLPAACQAYLIRDTLDGPALAGFVKEHETVEIGTVENLEAGRAIELARHLSPIQDAGAPVLDASGIPRSVSYLALAGTSLASDPRPTVERWQENGSLLGRARPRSKTPATLRALVGQGAQGEFTLDLRAQGPHALVGGTSGAGKSEFLQSWILGMASGHSPQRVTFLFVDYKGGSAFADCVKLPHCVGLVTDLSPHLVRRALTSLRAELRHREHLLNRKNAKDLISLERTGDPECPPALVIVVDEFAALVTDVPEFLDGMVDVAQRGRSLGLHLILATQRPTGVIKGNLRANTALRVALRMADEADSTDVIDSELAAQFDPRIPGRGAVRTGPGRISLFQAGYAGGRTSSEPEPARIDIETLTFGPGLPWEIPSSRQAADDTKDEGPTDIARIVDTIATAAAACRLPAPRKPWLPELEATYDLEALLESHQTAAAAGKFLLGVADDPSNQAQHPVFWDPDLEGNLAVYGASGAGKSTVLRTLATVSAANADVSRTEVYGLDFGTGGLAMLQPLPLVGAVIEGADKERADRLLRRLTDILNARATAYAAARAGSISEYRQATGRTDEARIVLLVDGFAAFREEFEATASLLPSYARLSRLMTEGRAAGIHVVVSAERPNALPSSLAATVQRRLVLRQADENGYNSLNIPKDILGAAPPGRAVFSGETNELQVAVPGGSTTPADQSLAIDRLAERLRGRRVRPAEPVRRLATHVDEADLPSQVGGLPVLGINETDLAPIGFQPQGAFLIAGMPGSGRTTSLRAVCRSLRRWQPTLPMYYIGPRRSVVHTDPVWTSAALDQDAIKELAATLKPLADKAPISDVVPGFVLVIEGVGELVSTPVEQSVLEIIKAARRNGHLIVGEQETSSWAAGWPIISEIRNNRHGIVVQPDPGDGDILFKVALPRVKRADYPPGRAVYVRSGKMWTVQLPFAQ